MSKVVAAPTLRFKGMNNILFAGALVIISVIALLNSESIRAQITNLYSASNDEVAGITSLMTAAASGDLEGARFFSKGGAAMVNQRNLGGATALHIAAREDDLEIAKILIENGANVHVVDNEGWTPLMRAAIIGSVRLINLLLDNGADASAFNSVNESAIILATTADCAECLIVMFDKFNFIKMLSAESLNQQINDSYVIARNHENDQVQKILGDYLERVSKINALNEPQDIDLNQSNLNPAPVINQVSPIQSDKSGKRFKFAGSSNNKVDKVEVVDHISIKKANLASVTELSPVNNETLEVPLDDKKIVYKFLGQSGSSISVQNYQAKVKGLLQDNSSEQISKVESVKEVSEIKKANPEKSYKFIGQSGESIAVKNYNHQLQKNKDFKAVPVNVLSDEKVELNSTDNLGSKNSPKIFKLKKN